MEDDLVYSLSVHKLHRYMLVHCESQHYKIIIAYSIHTFLSCSGLCCMFWLPFFPWSSFISSHSDSLALLSTNIDFLASFNLLSRPLYWAFFFWYRLLQLDNFVWLLCSNSFLDCIKILLSFVGCLISYSCLFNLLSFRSLFFLHCAGNPYLLSKCHYLIIDIWQYTIHHLSHW